MSELGNLEAYAKELEQKVADFADRLAVEELARVKDLIAKALNRSPAPEVAVASEPVPPVAPSGDEVPGPAGPTPAVAVAPSEIDRRNQ